MTNGVRSEIEETRRDAFSSEGKSFAERTAMFESLMEVIDAVQRHFSSEERTRRMRIADQLDPRPDPWWKNFRDEALAEYRCQISST
jgi:hypothetical protein